jgi:hypothetical protein
MPPYVDLSTSDMSLICEYPVQVAYSFVGRWFKLEGSGVDKERDGSRFLVCSFLFVFSCSCSQCLSRLNSVQGSPHGYVKQSHAFEWSNLLPFSGCNGVHRPSTVLYISSFNQTDECSLCSHQISVNASILSDSGGTCECTTGDGCTSDATYLACVSNVRRDLITTTAAVAALGSFLIGLLANLPIGMAPGLGLNAYVCIRLGIFSSLSDLMDSLLILLLVSMELVSSVIVKPSQLFSWKGT